MNQKILGMRKFLYRRPFILDRIKNIIYSPIIVNNKSYQNFVMNYFKYYSKKKNSKHKRLLIETSLSCNSRCIMCYHSKKKLLGIMKMRLFLKIIDDCKKNKISFVYLSVYGEPLMDPFLLKRIEHLKKNNILFGFYTNASLLTEKISMKLLSYLNFKSITFNVSGYSKGVYEKVMPGLDRNVTYHNINKFLALKKKLKRTDVETTVAMVKTKHNIKELKKYYTYWKRKKGLDYIRFYDLWDRVGKHDISSVGDVGILHKKGKWQSPCMELWGNLNVYYNGKVSPCCDDNDLRQLIVGDLSKETLSDIFSGYKLNNLRKIHLSNNRKNHKICGSCHHNHEWF